MHVATAQNQPSFAQRIAFPSPEARQAREEVRRRYQAQAARVKLNQRRRRLEKLRASEQGQADLAVVAAAAAPDTTDASCWPTDIQELADTIQRQAIIYRNGRQINPGNLNPGEAPVRDRDRQIILKALPPSVEVQRCDPTYA